MVAKAGTWTSIASKPTSLKILWSSRCLSSNWIICSGHTLHWSAQCLSSISFISSYLENFCHLFQVFIEKLLIRCSIRCCQSKFYCTWRSSQPLRDSPISATRIRKNRNWKKNLSRFTMFGINIHNIAYAVKFLIAQSKSNGPIRTVSYSTIFQQFCILMQPHFPLSNWLTLQKQWNSFRPIKRPA